MALYFSRVRTVDTIIIATLIAASGFSASAQAQSAIQTGGALQAEIKRIVDAPARWSTLRLRGDWFASGKLGSDSDNRFRLALRADTDFASRTERDFYPRRLDREQRFNLDVREAWVDLPADNFSLRVGRQYINWGEAIGVFVADVVNARDLREFVATDLDQIRIGQWALRGDWAGEDKQAELLWIPYPSFDDISVPGSDYYPVLQNSPGLATQINEPHRPQRKLSNSNWGARGGFLKNGWDVSAFYYRSLDTQVAFARNIGSTTLTYTPTFGNRIWQSGVTGSKDLDFAVFKFETVYTHGRLFSVNRSSDADGLVSQNTFEWLLGLDIPVGEDTRFNVQAYQRAFLDHDPDLLNRRHENLMSVQVTQPFGKWEAVAILVRNLNSSDMMFRPRLNYRVDKNLRLTMGADIFSGPSNGLFGQYGKRDRVYVTLKQSF